MGLSSSAKHFKDYVTSLESRVSLTAYYPAANGLAEASNKTIGKILKKFVSKSQRDWDDKLGECLLGYRTMVRTPMKATPFSLVYGVWSRTPTGNPDPISTRRLDNRDDK